MWWRSWALSFEEFSFPVSAAFSLSFEAIPLQLFAGTFKDSSKAIEKSKPKMSPVAGHPSPSEITVDISGGICASPTPTQSELGTIIDSKKEGNLASKSR